MKSFLPKKLPAIGTQEFCETLTLIMQAFLTDLEKRYGKKEVIDNFVCIVAARNREMEPEGECKMQLLFQGQNLQTLTALGPVFSAILARCLAAGLPLDAARMDILARFQGINNISTELLQG